MLLIKFADGWCTQWDTQHTHIPKTTYWFQQKKKRVKRREETSRSVIHIWQWPILASCNNWKYISWSSPDAHNSNQLEFLNNVANTKSVQCTSSIPCDHVSLHRIVYHGFLAMSIYFDLFFSNILFVVFFVCAKDKKFFQVVACAQNT